MHLLVDKCLYQVTPSVSLGNATTTSHTVSLIPSALPHPPHPCPPSRYQRLPLFSDADWSAAMLTCRQGQSPCGPVHFSWWPAGTIPSSGHLPPLQPLNNTSTSPCYFTNARNARRQLLRNTSTALCYFMDAQYSLQYAAEQAAAKEHKHSSLLLYGCAVQPTIRCRTAQLSLVSPALYS